MTAADKKEIASLKARLALIAATGEKALRGPARAQEHYTAAIRKIREIATGAEK